MSKRRSIASKVQLELDFPLPEPPTRSPLPNSTQNCKDKYFGEKIKHKDNTVRNEIGFCVNSASSNNYTDDEDIFDFDTTGYSKSSGSSTSALDDVELESTQKVKHELENIESQIYGDVDTEVIPENEHCQWITNFPHLRIVGSRINIPSLCHLQNDSDNFEEIIAEHYDTPKHINKLGVASTENIKSKIKEAVIENIFQNVRLKCSMKREEINSCSPVKKTNELQQSRIYKNKSKKISESHKSSASNETFLQVSSKPLYGSPMRCPKFEYQSPVMRSHLSASKWQKDNLTSEYSSLPLLTPTYVPYNSENKKCEPLSGQRHHSDVVLNTFSANSRKESGIFLGKTSKYLSSPSSKTKNVILPPIQNLHLSTDIDNYKSVSSTPRKLHVATPVVNKMNSYSSKKTCDLKYSVVKKQ